MKLRAYKKQDINQLLQVWWGAWHSSANFAHPRPIEGWKVRWEALLLTRQVAVIENDEGIVGFAAVGMVKRELSQLFVAPAHKTNGYGKIIFEWARGICGDSMKLKTLAENAEANFFYLSRGMKEAGYSFNDFNGMKEVVFIFEVENNAPKPA